jgi:hypothetical protein
MILNITYHPLKTSYLNLQSRKHLLTANVRYPFVTKFLKGKTYIYLNDLISYHANSVYQFRCNANTLGVCNFISTASICWNFSVKA